MFFIGISSTVIIATVGAQTLIAAGKDSLVLRGVRYTISNMIPIVGGVLSGTLSTILSGVKLLSGAVGIFSVIAIITVTGAPLLTFLYYRVCISFCSILVSFFGSVSGERFFEGLRGGVDLIISVIGSVSVIYILEIVTVVGCAMGVG